ncbi:NgoMIV family type II restriction endonuclease [bacterium]|nr:NgoMIV family type II restriction endonuclease [bacterium]
MPRQAASQTIAALRTDYHRAICTDVLAWRPGPPSLNIADSSSRTSKALAEGLAARLPHPLCRRAKDGQTTGTLFTEHTRGFLEKAFECLHHLRPGEWLFSTSQASAGIAQFDQYEHLNELQRVLAENPELRAALGGDYLVTPDIIVARAPVDDPEINRLRQIVGPAGQPPVHTPLRAANVPSRRAILHASISCKWTIRSDRAQNTRTEALNLIRNRKGKTPIIAAVTAEPLPTRLASIAMGTGDIDCVYHFALHELQEAVAEADMDGQEETLSMLVEGRRLRDICDLPFDLAT